MEKWENGVWQWTKGWMKVKDWKNRGSHTKPIGYGAAT